MNKRLLNLVGENQKIIEAEENKKPDKEELHAFVEQGNKTPKKKSKRQVQGKMPKLTFPVSGRIYTAFLQAVLDRKSKKAKIRSQQGLLSSILENWLEKEGYLTK